MEIYSLVNEKCKWSSAQYFLACSPDCLYGKFEGQETHNLDLFLFSRLIQYFCTRYRRYLGQRCPCSLWGSGLAGSMDPLYFVYTWVKLEDLISLISSKDGKDVTGLAGSQAFAGLGLRRLGSGTTAGVRSVSQPGQQHYKPVTAGDLLAGTGVKPANTYVLLGFSSLLLSWLYYPSKRLPISKSLTDFCAATLKKVTKISLLLRTIDRRGMYITYQKNQKC